MAATSYKVEPEKLVGTFRRFGEFGPVYEILAMQAGGMVEIEVPETGEKTSVSLDEVLEDPEVREAE